MIDSEKQNIVIPECFPCLSGGAVEARGAVPGCVRVLLGVKGSGRSRILTGGAIPQERDGPDRDSCFNAFYSGEKNSQ